MTTPCEQLQLEKFYQKFRRSLKAHMPAELGRYSSLYGPDLIWLDNDYLNSRPRMAIIGQQVYSWYYNYREFVTDVWEYYYAKSTAKGSVKKAIAEYRGFDFAFSEKEPLRRTPFWQFFHKVRESAFSTEREARRKVLWTNLVKFVAKDGTKLLEWPYAEAEEAIQLQDDVLTTELRIANPDVCLFVTGPDFDCILKRYFRDVKFIEASNLPKHQFARLVHEDLPRRSYRTYHPGYLSYHRKLWKEVLHILSQELAWPNSRGGANRRQLPHSRHSS
jgi:hypothetical protein